MLEAELKEFEPCLKFETWLKHGWFNLDEPVLNWKRFLLVQQRGLNSLNSASENKEIRHDPWSNTKQMTVHCTVLLNSLFGTIKHTVPLNSLFGTIKHTVPINSLFGTIKHTWVIKNTLTVLLMLFRAWSMISLLQILLIGILFNLVASKPSKDAEELYDDIFGRWNKFFLNKNLIF